MLEDVRRKAAEKAQKTASEPRQSDEVQSERDENGRFVPGHQKVGGRQAGTPNKIPRAVKEVMLGLAEGTLTTEDAKLFSAKVAEALSLGMEGKLIAAVSRGPNGETVRFEPRLGYVLAFLKYGLEREEKLKTGQGARSGPKIVFMGEAHDPMAKPGAPPEPLRMLGQVRNEKGEIVDFKTGKPVTPRKPGASAPPTPVVGQEPPPEDDEVLNDPIPPDYEERGPRAW